MNFKASKPDARILILQIVAACIAYRGDSRSFGCASVIPYDDRPGVSNLFAP